MGRKQVCTRCINDNTVTDIAFDVDGICNYCQEFERIAAQLVDYPRLQELWQDRLSMKPSPEGDYDVLLGISGGKDSTYVLYHLKKTYGLRVKTFTLNNGFLTSWAREKIKKVITILDVDHEYVDLPREKIKTLYEISMRYTGAPCLGCAVFGYTMTVSLAQKQRIPIAVHGRSHTQMFRYLMENGGSDAFAAFIYAGLKPRQEVDLNLLYESIWQNMRKSFPRSVVNAIEDHFPKRGSKDSAVEFLPYFLYHPYDKHEIISFLNENIDYGLSVDTDVFAHLDCEVHDAAGYLKELTLGRPSTMPEISVLVRAGKMTREQGIDKLRADSLQGVFPAESLSVLGNFTGKSTNAMLAGARNAKKLRSSSLAKAYRWVKRQL